MKTYLIGNEPKKVDDLLEKAKKNKLIKEILKPKEQKNTSGLEDLLKSHSPASFRHSSESLRQYKVNFPNYPDTEEKYRR
jgi:hypothetical protein